MILLAIANLTGVCVNYNTPELLKKAINSIGMFYDFPIIIINGSEEEIPGAVNVGYNIGHGLGMDMGIRMAKTDYILTFDTDIARKEQRNIDVVADRLLTQALKIQEQLK